MLLGIWLGPTLPRLLACGHGCSAGRTSGSRRTCRGWRWYVRHLHSSRPGVDRTIITDRLFRFYDGFAASGLPEAERLASMVNTLWPKSSRLSTAITELLRLSWRP